MHYMADALERGFLPSASMWSCGRGRRHWFEFRLAGRPDLFEKLYVWLLVPLPL